MSKEQRAKSDESMQMDQSLTFGSLFAGIGGIDLGFEKAGFHCKWQVECDPYALRVLEKHWPNVAKQDEVRTASGLPHVDVIVGGFPCQDISVAGRMEGIHGKRSGLFIELMRIVRDLRPRYVVLENVAALLFAGNGMDTVLGSLAACGYDAEWDCLPAAAFGAPHRRDRVFIVANARGKRCTWRKEECGSRAAQDSNWLWLPPMRHGGWSSEPQLGRVAYGVPNRMDRVRCLGNSVVPHIAEHVARCILRHASNEQRA